MSTSVAAPWDAPYVQDPITGAVSVPGSKSMTNRALVLAAVADRPTTIERPLLARDTRLMAAALSALGTEIVERDGGLAVTPAPLHGPTDIECGLAGTVMRFVPPVAALATGIVAFDGDARARERPMGEMLRALRTLGVRLDSTGSGLPFSLHGTGRVVGGPVDIDASSSSQFVSALLLAGARYDQGIDVRHQGKPVPSLPHIAMTVSMLRARGVDVDDHEPNRWRVSPGTVRGIGVEIEPDLSNAAPFLAAAVVTGGTVTVRGWPHDTLQPGDELRSVLALYGAEVSLDEDGLTVSGGDSVSGVDLDLHDVGELTPVLAAVCALADSPSYLRGVAHLRGHETDRLAALTTELCGLGGDVRETADGLEIRPAPLHGGLFRAYGDHRMAQAGAVLGLRVPAITVDDIASTAKTHEDFAAQWRALVA